MVLFVLFPQTLEEFCLHVLFSPPHSSSGRSERGQFSQQGFHVRSWDEFGFWGLCVELEHKF